MLSAPKILAKTNKKILNILKILYGIENTQESNSQEKSPAVGLNGFCGSIPTQDILCI